MIVDIAHQRAFGYRPSFRISTSGRSARAGEPNLSGI
jgi:hypothetical protein